MAFIKAGTLDDSRQLAPSVEVHCATGFEYALDDGTERMRFPADMPAG